MTWEPAIWRALWESRVLKTQSRTPNLSRKCVGLKPAIIPFCVNVKHSLGWVRNIKEKSKTRSSKPTLNANIYRKQTAYILKFILQKTPREALRLCKEHFKSLLAFCLRGTIKYYAFAFLELFRTKSKQWLHSINFIP